MDIRGRRPGRYGWAVVVIGTVVIASDLTRLIVFAISDHTSASALTFVRAFVVGGLYDVLVGAWLAAPVMLYLTLVSQKRYPRKGQRILRRTGLALFLGFVFFTIAAEVLFFQEFDGRFNFVAVDYLIYPTEVVTNIWQSYPLVWVLVGIGALVGGALWVMRPALESFDAEDGVTAGRRWIIAGAYAGGLAAMTLLITPRLSHVSDDRVLNEVASSGYYTFWEAFLGTDAPYKGLYATRPDSAVNARLRTLLNTATSVTDSGARELIPGVTLTRHPANVVVILEESFGAAFVSSIHPRDSLPLTPSFDSLAAEGLLLTRAYATGNRTIRAIEATTASLPPLPGVSIVRRTQSVNLFTLPAVLHANGFGTEFIYGGRALFDGMGSYVRQNGFERIVEQKDFPGGSYKTAWGVADEVIFDKALTELDSLHRTGAPFYSLILTVSNHKPYTYPTGRIPEDPAQHRRTFAVRYSDWALGRFMRAARSHPFFDNTLFVIMGDHGARVYGSAQIPLPSYEVPILFYMPGSIAAGGRMTTLTSSLDVPPTVLGLLGITGPSKFFGRDLFAPNAAPGHALMTHNSELALMRGDRMAVLGLRGITTVNHIDSAGKFQRVMSPDATDRELIEDAIAYFQGADMTYRSGGYQFDAARVPNRK